MGWKPNIFCVINKNSHTILYIYKQLIWKRKKWVKIAWWDLVIKCNKVRSCNKGRIHTYIHTEDLQNFSLLKRNSASFSSFHSEWFDMRCSILEKQSELFRVVLNGIRPNQSLLSLKSPSWIDSYCMKWLHCLR